MLNLLTELCEYQGISVIAVHHDLRTVLTRFHHAVLLAGTVIASGDVRDVLTPMLLEQAYGAAPLAVGADHVLGARRWTA